MNSRAIHITFLNEASLAGHERGWTQELQQELAPAVLAGKVAYAPDPGKADIIVMLESCVLSGREYIGKLLRDPNIKNFSEKVYTINYEDQPAGYLTGLYTSICAPNYKPARHRSWPPLFLPCDPLYELSDETILGTERKWLFSFMGAESHPLRTKIFAKFGLCSDGDIYVEHVNRQFNHTKPEILKYVGISLQSKFVLCPRGNAPFSYRICEAMAMGRAPVVIADKWIPFAFEEQIPYYVRIPESRFEDAVDILREKETQAEELGQNARQLWKKYSSRQNRIYEAVQEIMELQDSASARRSYCQCAEEWQSNSFLSQRGWTFRQRLMRKVRGLGTRLVNGRLRPRH